MRKNKGITLVALIITIIIILILVAVSVNVLVKSNLIGTAENAANKYSKSAKEEENIASDLINKYLNEEEDYDPDGWVMAWTCSDGGNWSDTIEQGGKAEGDIVAKLYKTGKTITPAELSFAGITKTFDEGDEYDLVIEGSGTMGDLAVTENSYPTQAMGWLKSTFLYFVGESDTCISPYIKKIVVKEGIKNLGSSAISTCESLTEIKLPQSLETIDDYVFQLCNSLEEITIPKNVKKIGQHGFNNITSEKLIIKVLTPDANIVNYAFYTGGINNAKIYVLNNTIKEKIENANIDINNTTVEVVTEEQMKSL